MSEPHLSHEPPLAAATRLAERCRASSTDDTKKQWGQYFTSPVIAAFMASLVERPRARRAVRILDPGAGTGVLGIALAQRLVAEGTRVHLVAIEAEPTAATHLEESLHAARRRLGEAFSFEVSTGDFLDLDAPTLGTRPIDPFDVAIGNPPYFKVSPTEVRGGDAPNIYARFMEVAARLLVPGGQLCFIVPRSFASGFYFQRFRRRFHASMRLERVHVFESRRAAFKADGVLQENLVVHYRKEPDDGGRVIVSSSAGEHDLAERSEHVLPRRRVVASAEGHGTIFLPLDAQDVAVLDLFRSLRHTLALHGLDVSTGPVVPFRSEHELVSVPKSAPTVPMLWMQHVRAGAVTWPLGPDFRKPEHIRASAPAKLLVPSATYILMRRFSAKEEERRLVAAVLREGQLPGASLGLENHLNFIHRPGGRLGELQLHRNLPVRRFGPREDLGHRREQKSVCKLVEQRHSMAVAERVGSSDLTLRQGEEIPREIPPDTCLTRCLDLDENHPRERCLYRGTVGKIERLCVWQRDRIEAGTFDHNTGFAEYAEEHLEASSTGSLHPISHLAQRSQLPSSATLVREPRSMLPFRPDQIDGLHSDPRVPTMQAPGAALGNCSGKPTSECAVIVGLKWSAADR
jgi:adenine-specific DNA-methyltransferase